MTTSWLPRPNPYPLNRASRRYSEYEDPMTTEPQQPPEQEAPPAPEQKQPPKQEAAPPPAHPEGTQKKEPAPVPFARFQEVNQELSILRQQKAERDAAD